MENHSRISVCTFHGSRLSDIQIQIVHVNSVILSIPNHMTSSMAQTGTKKLSSPTQNLSIMNYLLHEIFFN